MSRRIRRGRRGIDLPLKNPPTSTDRVIGHDASGNMHQFLADALGGDFDIGALPNRATPASTDRFPLQTSGGIDYRTTLAGIIAGMVTNITAAQINELFKREFSLIVPASTGSPTVMLPDRLTVTVTRTGVGTYEYMAPPGYRFAAVNPVPILSAYSVRVNDFRTPGSTAVATFYNTSGGLVDAWHHVNGTLREA